MKKSKPTTNMTKGDRDGSPGKVPEVIELKDLNVVQSPANGVLKASDRNETGIKPDSRGDTATNQGAAPLKPPAATRKPPAPKPGLVAGIGGDAVKAIKLPSPEILAATSVTFAQRRKKIDCETGTIYLNKYEVIDVLGYGSYGVVVKVLDLKTKTERALKFVQLQKTKRENKLLRREAEVLHWINEKRPAHNIHIVDMESAFYYKGTLCINLPLYCMSLTELLEEMEDNQLPLGVVRKITKQMLTALEFLSSRDVGIVHCDIKPDNIMVTHTKLQQVNVQLIDFGLSRHTTDCVKGAEMQTYPYRSPEITFGTDYGTAIDMWSLGVVISELYLGHNLFPVPSAEHLVAFYIQTFGDIPLSILDNGKHTDLFYTRAFNGFYVFKPEIPASPLSFSLKRRITYELGVHNKSGRKLERKEFDDFFNLVTSMLTYHGDRRITPQAALSHPFIKPVPVPIPVPVVAAAPNGCVVPRHHGEEIVDAPLDGPVHRRGRINPAPANALVPYRPNKAPPKMTKKQMRKEQRELKKEQDLQKAMIKKKKAAIKKRLQQKKKEEEKKKTKEQKKEEKRRRKQEEKEAQVKMKQEKREEKERIKQQKEKEKEKKKEAKEKRKLGTGRLLRRIADKAIHKPIAAAQEIWYITKLAVEAVFNENQIRPESTEKKPFESFHMASFSLNLSDLSSFGL